jgi:hypothetical protein
MRAFKDLPKKSVAGAIMQLTPETHGRPIGILCGFN